MRWVLRAAILLLPACFHPVYDHPACGPGGECPGGLACSLRGFCERLGDGAGNDDAGVDTPGMASDAASMPLDAPPTGNEICYGPSGWKVCLDAKATGTVPLSGALDTDRSDAANPCLKTQLFSWPATQPEVCVIAGDTVTIASLSVTGNRPLVIVAQTKITVTTLLDVASHRDTGAVGAGTASPADCKPFGGPPSQGPPGGGGAGGGFLITGGNGGTGNGAAPAPTAGGLAAAALVGAPARLRGGCLGQAGGGGTDNDAGAGGGAVYLVSAGTISIPGQINASGAGGKGRNALHGGAGGGSGGMIVLHAASIATMSTTVLIAGGGGGGGGSSGPDTNQQTARGDDGHDLVLAFPLQVLGGTGGTLPTAGFNGGDGGRGYPVPSDMMFKLTGLNGDISAGGGGGGGGGGYIRSNLALGAAAVSPAVDIKP